MIIDSIINICLIPVFSIFLSYRVSIILDNTKEKKLTHILLNIVKYIKKKKKNRHERLFLENFFLLRMKYSFIYLLGILYFFTPNRSFYGNVSGILGGFIIRKYRNILLPKIIWIYDFENNFGLNKIKSLYRKININNNEMRIMLREFDRDSVDEIVLNYEIINQ